MPLAHLSGPTTGADTHPSPHGSTTDRDLDLGPPHRRLRGMRAVPVPCRGFREYQMMEEIKMPANTQGKRTGIATCVIHASPEAPYNASIDPAALTAPGRPPTRPAALWSISSRGSSSPRATKTLRIVGQKSKVTTLKPATP